MLTQVLDCVGVAVEEDIVSPREAARVYALPALCYNPANQQQTLMLFCLQRHTEAGPLAESCSSQQCTAVPVEVTTETGR